MQPILLDVVIQALLFLDIVLQLHAADRPGPHVPAGPADTSGVIVSQGEQP